MSDNDPDILQSLQQVRDALLRRIDTLKLQVGQIEELISQHSGAAEGMESSRSAIPKIPPLEAARAFFTVNSGQQFSAADLKDHLQSMRKQGQLRSSAKNLMFASNDVLRKLVDRKEIVRLEEGRQVKYKVAE